MLVARQQGVERELVDARVPPLLRWVSLPCMLAVVGNSSTPYRSSRDAVQ